MLNPYVASNQYFLLVRVQPLNGKIHTSSYLRACFVIPVYSYLIMRQILSFCAFSADTGILQHIVHDLWLGTIKPNII